jgi:hypothetical protein
MKQLVLVLLIAATTLSVSAQKDYRNDNRSYDKYDRNDRYDDRYDRDNRRNHRYRNNDRFDRREKEALRHQLEAINHRYDAKINAISRKPFMRSSVKARRINELERERRIALNECRAKFYRKLDYTRHNRKYKRSKW